MRTTFKILGFLLIVLMMLYNVKISTGTNNGKVLLAYVKNTAQAQSENPPKGAATMTSDSYTLSITRVNSDGTVCTVSQPYISVQCSGEGGLTCVPSNNPNGPPSTSGSCPVH